MVLAAVGSVSLWVAYLGIREQTAENRRSANSFRLSLSVDLCLKLDERFSSHSFRCLRSAAARALLESTDLSEAEEVFDYFDTVGELVKSGALTPEIVHSFFFHWINLYWNAGKNYILDMRKEAALLWEGFEYVYNEVTLIERQRDPSSQDLAPSAQRLRIQLNDELSIPDS